MLFVDGEKLSEPQQEENNKNKTNIEMVFFV
jgi:hypothetical protein